MAPNSLFIGIREPRSKEKTQKSYELFWRLQKNIYLCTRNREMMAG